MRLWDGGCSVAAVPVVRGETTKQTPEMRGTKGGGVTPNLLQGDCFEVLQTLEPDSVDSCVTDPPYGLSFMGKHWDKGVPDADMWRQVFRVLKPGAHLLSFFGTRTYHRGVVAIEDAGFEIRDQIGWLYGSGFPKSLDIGKAIDKAAGAEREVVGTGRSGDNAGMQDLGPSGIKGGEYGITAPATDAAKQWDGWGTALKPCWESICLARKPLVGTVANNILTHGVGGLNIDACRVTTGQRPWENDQGLCDLCAEDAGKAPKPTTAETAGSTATANAEQRISEKAKSTRAATSKTDTGCSDGTRAGDTSTSLSTDEPGNKQTALFQEATKSITSTTTRPTTESRTCSSCGRSITSPCTSASTTHGSKSLQPVPGSSASAAPAGRWPGNLIHDGSDEVLAEFAKYGERHGGDHVRNVSKEVHNRTNSMGKCSNDYTTGGYNDAGTAARFFYTAKASKDDRNDGLHDYEHTNAADMVDREPGSDGMNSPRAGAGRTSGAKNHHPTVKPTSLMRYLVRLVTPKGGLVLDPFAGSGTTLIAAYREDCRAIGIELDPEYFKMANHRIDRATSQLRLDL
jgi:DNA modification methylase